MRVFGRSTIRDWCNLPESQCSNEPLWGNALRSILASLFIQFRRTFLVIDGLNELNTTEGSRASGEIEQLLRWVLEQDFGNVSVAIFSRPLKWLDPLLQIADVSIRLTQLEPDLGEYIQCKVGQKIKPMLVAANLDHDDGSIAAIEKVLAEASDGL